MAENFRSKRFGNNLSETDGNWRRGGNESSSSGQTGRSTFYSRTTNRGPKTTVPSWNRRYNSNLSHAKGFNNDKYSRADKSMGFMYLENLVNSDPEKILLTLVKERQGFSSMLEKELSADSIVLIISILKKVSSSAFSDTKYNILHSSFNEKFINKLQTFIACLPVQDSSQKRFSKYFWKDPDQFWINLLDIFEDLLNTTPTFACKNIPLLLNSFKIYSPIIEQVHGIKISEDAKNRIEELDSLFQIFIQENEEKQKSTQEGESANSSEPPDDFRQISVYPSAEEIVGGRGFLRENVIKGPYKSVDHYLDVQFRLLREDFVGPLRDGVANYRSSTPNHLENVKVHKEVHFLNSETINEFYCLRLQFSFKKNKPLNFENSRRFMFGSLLCFTNDNFQTLFFGKVAQRKIEDLNKGQIIVAFDEKFSVNFNTAYLMVECGVYFEPYFHVLTVLKSMTEANFPMERYFIRVKSSVQPPEYLTDVDCEYEIENKLFNPLTDWPSENFYNLNESQMVAFKAALTQEISVIQGPPGTGKTYLGLKIAQTLLNNKDCWYDYTPILVICYTNHALDQFLEGIIPFTENIVRVGGQSKNARLEMYNLRNKTERDDGVAEKRREVQNCLHEIKQITENLEQISFYNSVVSFDNFAVLPGFRGSWFAYVNKHAIIEWLLEGGTHGYQCQNNLHAMKVQEEFNRIGINEEFDETDDDFDDFNDHIISKFDPVFDILDLSRVRKSFFLITLGSLRDQIKRFEDGLFKLNKIENPSLQELIAEEEMRIQIMGLKQTYEYLKKHLAEGRTLQDCVEEPQNIDLQKPMNMDFESRWKLYFYWLSLYKKHESDVLKMISEDFPTTYKEYEEMRQIEDVRAMKTALVVGMTTTSAARLRSSLQTLKNPIVIVEEAAEVLEAHIVTSITKHCKHLILIGDHKQLKPTTANYSMEKQYRLGISLFERMIINNIHCYTLNVQHRMRPEISCLIRPTIYDFLEDHPSVFQRPSITGIDKCVFFVDHDHREESYEGSSKTNQHEVTFLIYLARHLVLNGYSPNNITILAAYLGQFFEFVKMRKAHVDLLDGIKIAVLDNYQGEESDIILLSLVRNNDENKIGFLSIENRVCVALSRARNGMYIMGNMSQLCSNELWRKIKTTLEKQNSLGAELPLRCQIHQDQVTLVKCENDFFSVSEGGCSKKCDMELNCGHKCTYLCHIRDRRHTNYKCRTLCNKVLCTKNADHVCKKMCYENCGPCGYMVETTLKCGHKVSLQCHIDPETYGCQVPVPTVLPCGHKADKPCYNNPETYRCPHICDVQVQPCGHSCVLDCHIRNDPEHLQYQCRKPCTKFMKDCSVNEEDHKCKKMCFEECNPCTIIIRKKRAFCSHHYDVHCNSDVNDFICEKPCTKKLKCGHQCKAKCHEPCKPCYFKVTKTVPLCGHPVKLKCCEIPNRSLCNKLCPLELPCGHPCTTKCNEPCTTNCAVLVDCPGIEAPCGHFVTKTECYMTRSSVDPKSLLNYCTQPCGMELKCGHVCSGTCGECMQGRIHKRCSQKCGTRLVCDHECDIPCRQSCRPCRRVCSYKCQHSICRKTCGEVCTPCKEPCARKCKHQYCTKLCGDFCNVPPCSQPCYKSLKCGHQCIGFCGDPCPPKCMVCNKDELLEVFFGTESEDARYVFLNDCKHIVENTGMEQWLQMNENQISYKVCPMCKTAIRTTQRYRDYIKKAIKDIAQVKATINGKREQILDQCKVIHFTLKNLKVTSGKLQTYCPQVHIFLNNIQVRVQPNKKGQPRDINIFEAQSLFTKLQLFEDVVNVCCKKNVQIDGTAELLFSQINVILNVLLRDDLTNQEIEDVSLEITRLARIVEFSCLQTTLQFSYMSNIRESAKNLVAQIEDHLFDCIRFTTENNNLLKTLLTELDAKMETGLAISDLEKREILKAMGFTKGHWFKCPNGHIYAIGECGGAMQESNCNECGERIGGSRHQLLSTNAVATEMDGALHGAWSVGANVQNYDLDAI